MEKYDNVPDSDAIEALAELEEIQRGEEPLMFHRHPWPWDRHHRQRNIASFLGGARAAPSRYGRRT